MSEDRRDPKRPRGRPREVDHGSRVSTFLPAGAHDRLIHLAQRRGITVSATVRQLLVVRLSSNSSQ